MVPGSAWRTVRGTGSKFPGRSGPENERIGAKRRRALRRRATAHSRFGRLEGERRLADAVEHRAEPKAGSLSLKDGSDVPHRLSFSESGAAAEIVISGAQANALDRPGIEELHQLLEQVAASGEARSVVLTGAEATFCGGRIRNPALVTAAEIESDLAPILEMNRLLEGYPLTLIAAVEGAAFGFGFGLATLCDITVAADDARFALTELAHGIPPLIVLSYFLRFVPYKVAFDLAHPGREIDAAEALRLGLVTSVAPAGATLAAARRFAATIETVDPEAMLLLREYSRRNATLVDDRLATEGAGRIAALLALRSGPAAG